ncbi:MAG: PASTA domain-containing protein [Bacteroidetes bacterium]|nr:PASTA domain-containing protein [Bacteroidota bacterium]
MYKVLGGLVAAGVIFVLLLDLLIMPFYTNYNEGVTVPDVTKVSLAEAETILEDYGLRHEVIDRRAHSAYPADYIIDQSPSPKQIVKPERKVYLTVNTTTTCPCATQKFSSKITDLRLVRKVMSRPGFEIQSSGSQLLLATPFPAALW